MQVKTDFSWLMSYGLPGALAAIGFCFLTVIWLKKTGPIEFREDRRELTIVTGALCILAAFLLLIFLPVPTPQPPLTPLIEEVFSELMDKHLESEPHGGFPVPSPLRIEKIFTSVKPQKEDGAVLQGDFRVAGQTAYLLVSGSAFSKKEKATLSMAIEVNGRVIGTLHSFSNEEWSHKRFIPAILKVSDDTVGAGIHSLTLRLSKGTHADFNDRFDVTLIDF